MHAYSRSIHFAEFSARAYGNIVSLFKHGVFVSLKRKGEREKLHCINEVKRCIQKDMCV